MSNSRCLTGVLLALTVSFMSAQVRAVEFPGEIDITAAVREADAGTTTLDSGGCPSGYTVSNAFGIGEAKLDRVMLTNAYNRILWTIAETFEAGKPIVVTKYTIKRTSPASGAADDYGYRRAPKTFFFQGSYNGSDWITLSEISTTWDENTLEQTFEIDPLYYGDYRKYRFVTGTTDATSGDSVKCSFQYIKVYGAIGDWAPLAAAAKPIEYLYNRSTAAFAIPIYTPTLDSKIELDVALTDITGTQAILVAGDAGKSNQMRLFHTEANGWVYYYGDNESYSSGKKATANARYHIVIDGPVVTINGKDLIDAGETVTANAGMPLAIAGSFSGELTKLYNIAKVKFWSVKAYDRDGNLALDLKPMLDRDGVGVWQDDLTKRLFDSLTVDSTSRLKENGRITEYIVNVTDFVRKESPIAPTVTLVEGTAHADYPVSNLFTTVQNSANRALFTAKKAVVQYDIPDTYHTGWPIVLTHYGVIPAGFGTGGSDSDFAKKRAPNKIELWASTEGGEGWDGWVKIHERHCGLGPGFFGKGEIRDLTKDAGGKVNFRGYLGSTFMIPEENRGDYRHYRFVMDGSSAAASDTVPLSLQELRFFGYDGGFEPRDQPVSFLQNGLEQQNGKNTYVKTGVKPASVEGFTIEIKGSFTKIDATSCLFCARDNNSDNTWTLFLLNSALRLDCKTASGSTSGFRPDQNKEYTFKVTGNVLSVYDANGTQVHTSTAGSTDFTPGSEIVLMASHKAASGGWDNQARFKMTACKITDRFGGVVFDGVPCERTSDGKSGLFDRVTRKFKVAEGEAGSKHGDSVDCDFTQRGRTVTMTSALDAKGCVPETVDFTFTDNQMIAAELFAAFDNVRKGTDFDSWEKKVKLGELTTGIDSLTNVPLENPENYKFVKFFVRDPMERACSQTRIYRAFVPGMTVILR